MALLIALFWGSTYPVVRVAGSPSMILLGRYVLSSITSAAILTRPGSIAGDRVRKELIKILASGAANMCFVVSMYYALLYIPSGPVSAIVYTYPLLILLISSLTGYEGIGFKAALGSLVAFMGVLTIYAPSRLNIDGVLLSITAAISFAVASVISSRISIDRVALTALQNLVGLPIAVAVYMLAGGGSGLDAAKLIAMLHQGLGASFLAYIAWYRLLSRSIAVASSMVYMVPAAAYITAIPIAGEVPSIYQIFGLFLILMGIYIARR